MATLTPVDHDPFATPVDHDPFADAPAAAPSNPNAYVPGQIAGHQIPGLATLDNMTRVAQDAMTFGGADAATGGTASADTQTARNALGPVGSGLADVAGYAAGPGEVGAGAGIAKLMGSGLVARMAGSGVEGAGAAALGTAGHGDLDPGDIGKSAAMGGATGALTGALPVPRDVPQTRETPDLMNDAHNAWKATYGAPVNPSDVSSALVQAHLGLTPGERVLMNPSTGQAINKAMNESQGMNSLSGNDLKKFQDAIMGSTRDPQELAVAGKFRDALDGAYGPQAQPLVSAANAATSKAKTSSELDDLIANPKSAPDDVTSMLKKNPGLYARIRPALAPVAAMANPTLGGKIKNVAINAGLGAAGGLALSQFEDTNMPGSMIAGATMGAIKGHIGNAIQQRPIVNMLKSAQHMNATGAQLPPSRFTAPSAALTMPSDLLRKYLYSQGASGSGF